MADKKTIDEILAIMQEQVEKNVGNKHTNDFRLNIRDTLLESGPGALDDFNWSSSKYLKDTDFEFVDRYGGEGQGDYYNVTYKYKPTEQYFGPVGWYASYEGYELDEVKLQEPKTVTVYR
jgi:hypothetical protein